MHPADMRRRSTAARQFCNPGDPTRTGEIEMKHPFWRRLLTRAKSARVGLCAIIALASLPPMTVSFAASTITYVQGNYTDPQSSQTSVTIKYNSAQTAGNLNVVVVGWNDSTSAVASVTD